MQKHLQNKKNTLSLHRVFHGIRFKVNKWSLGCRETTFSFLRAYLVCCLKNQGNNHCFRFIRKANFTLKMYKLMWVSPHFLRFPDFPDFP